MTSKSLLAYTLLTVFLLTVTVGCGGATQLDVAPVSGTVTLDGKLLTSGTVLFVPKGGRSAKGLIQSDGTFRLGTYGKADGAILGANRVVVTPDTGEYTGPGGPGMPSTPVKREPGFVPIPRKYCSPATTDLTFDVKPGVDNVANITLSSTQ